MSELPISRAFRRSVPAILLAATALLSACALPRGAGLQSEVLAASETTTADGTTVTTADFSVEPVTRAALPRYARWPLLGEPPQNWITRQEQPSGHIIAPGDTVSLTVWNTEENALLTAPGQRFVPLTDISVDSSGRIFLPYVGDFPIAGMSPQHAREEIERRFLGIIPAAQIQLEVDPGIESTVSVVGGVGSPGSYPLITRDRSILSILAEAGGVRESLNNPQIRLIRGGEIYGTAVSRLFETPALDTTLRGGDRILVEEDDRFFLSLGAAGSEAMHRFERDELTALEAMSIIGGVSDARADPQGILILRDYPASAVRADGSGPPMEQVVFTIDLTSADGLFSAGRFRIASGDLVYVTESPLTSAQTVFGLIGSVFGLARQASSVSG